MNSCANQTFAVPKEHTMREKLWLRVGVRSLRVLIDVEMLEMSIPAYA